MRCGGQEKRITVISDERERNVEGCRSWARRRMNRPAKAAHGPASSRTGNKGCPTPLLVRVVQHHVIQRQKPTCRAIVANYTHRSIQKRPLPTTQLSLNSTFNELATPAVFENITVHKNYTSTSRFWTVLHTPHIAQHVQSLTFVEGRPQ
jgi:hypothetical protein